MKTIDRKDLSREIEKKTAKFHLVEVLGEKEYSDFHLPHAVNIPFKGGKFSKEIKSSIPRKSDTVVVYCKDKKSDISLVAGKAMEKEGYSSVYRYAEGKEDWKKAGLKVEKSSKRKSA